jgi:hypothetical protein
MNCQNCDPGPRLNALRSICAVSLGTVLSVSRLNSPYDVHMYSAQTDDERSSRQAGDGAGPTTRSFGSRWKLENAGRYLRHRGAMVFRCHFWRRGGASRARLWRHPRDRKGLGPAQPDCNGVFQEVWPASAAQPGQADRLPRRACRSVCSPWSRYAF